jgi:hypothetical protein
MLSIFVQYIYIYIYISWFDLKVKTHVYVTGSPDDVTVEEVNYSYQLIL